MGATEETLQLLREIRDGINKLVAMGGTGGGSAAGAVATERELLSKWGDPEVRVQKLRDWTGPSFKGKRYSQCPPEFLDQLADLHDYAARKADEKNEKTDKGQPVADFRRRDARLARGWAQRMRDGKHTPPPPRQAPRTSGGWGSDDEDEAGFDPR